MHNRTEAVNSQAYCLAQSPASPSASSASYYHRLYANFLFNSMTSMRRNSAIPTGTQSLHRRFSLRERGERQSQSSSPAGGAANQSTTLLRTATLTAAAATASSQLQLGEMNSSSAASARRPSVSSTTSTGDSGLGRGGGGGLQQYRSRHDYLYAMTEDLADWLNFLYDRDITVESFFDELANGALLCIHAGQLQLAAEEYFSSQQAQQQQRQKLLRLPPSAPRYRLEAKAGTFQARDNIANFISWCRSLGLPDCLLFETEDLANRKNTRHVILCLLEQSSSSSRRGTEAPAAATALPAFKRKKPTRWQCDLKSLDELVRELINECTCEQTFPMKRLDEGKYLFGDAQMLIFVRQQQKRQQPPLQQKSPMSAIDAHRRNSLQPRRA
uniref:Calponin-homology (CH) domain-containing protein n=2 Tax=Macrostomum lignano TaxID=282301 RepID=A0A1I8GS55_9PLAT